MVTLMRSLYATTCWIDSLYPTLVCKLAKSLNGLCQASRQWTFKLSTILIDVGFVQSKSNYSLFTKRSSTVLTFVNDLILVGYDILEINKVKILLNQNFDIKDLGSL